MANDTCNCEAGYNGSTCSTPGNNYFVEVKFSIIIILF